MFVKLSKGARTIIINVDRVISAEAAHSVLIIMEQTKWILTHISSNNVTALWHDLQIVIPDLTLSDTKIIKDIIAMPIDILDKFIRICNVLAKEDIFHIEPYIDFVL